MVYKTGIKRSPRNGDESHISMSNIILCNKTIFWNIFSCLYTGWEFFRNFIFTLITLDDSLPNNNSIVYGITQYT